MAKWIEDPQGRLEVEKVTEELKLPVWKANYKGKFREFWNECWEKIEDSFLKLKKSNEGKEPAITTKETAFNKPFGVSEDTVLEGNKFTQMTGKDYGGILNIAGQKEAGKAYWDNNTKKLYICKNNNSDISPNVNNYIPFDSNSLLERLENLQRYEVLDKTSETKYTKLIFQKQGLIGHLFIDIPAGIAGKLRANDLLFTFPKSYKPKIFNIHLLISQPSGRSLRTRYEENTGKVYVLTPSGIEESIYLNALYIIED